MARVSIFFSAYKPKAISKQNSNSAGWTDPYAPKKKLVVKKKSNEDKTLIGWVECPQCKTVVKRLQSHLNRVHKVKDE